MGRYSLRLPSPAMVVALVALSVALGGTGYAAVSLPGHHGAAVAKKKKKTNDNAQDLAYWTSHKSLFTGQRGPVGPQGAQGAQGAQGQTGSQGPKGDAGAPGPFPATLPNGQSLRGYMTIFGTGTTVASNSAAFLYPLGTAPTPHYIASGGGVPAGCSGTASSPGAASGNLCVFELSNFNLASAGVNGPGGDGTTDVSGFSVFANGAAAGQFFEKVRWVVTG